MKTLCNPLIQGGLNVLDFEISNTIFKTKWIQNYIRSKVWYYIPNIIFEKVGGVEFLLNCNFNSSKLPIKLSNFHKQALLSWMIIYKHNFSPHKCLIWNNKYITQFFC